MQHTVCRCPLRLIAYVRKKYKSAIGSVRMDVTLSLLQITDQSPTSNKSRCIFGILLILKGFKLKQLVKDFDRIIKGESMIYKISWAADP